MKLPAELPPAPLPYFENIRAETAVEQQNIDAVRLSMQQGIKATKNSKK